MRFTVFLPTSWPQVSESAANSRIAPGRVLRRHPDHEPAWRFLSSTRGRPGPRRWLPSYFLAISSLYQRKKVSGVTRSSISFRPSLPNVRAFAASRRRCASVKRSRRPRSCSRTTRFSSFRYSIASCWNRLTHPAKAMAKNCQRHGCMGSDSSRPLSPAGLLLDASTTCLHSASGVDRVLAHHGHARPCRDNVRPRGRCRRLAVRCFR